MGKLNCGMTGGYESPAFGSWGWGITAQLLVALLFVLSLSSDAVPLSGAEVNQLQFADKTTFAALAATHGVCAVGIAVLTILGYLVSSCFLCPLGIVSIAVQIVLLVTCGICGSLLSSALNFSDGTLNALRAGEDAPVPSASEAFVLENEGKLLLICILCLTAVVPFSRGASLESKAPAYEVLLYSNSLALFIASASVFLFIRAVPALAGLATAWLIVAVAIGVAIVIQKSCCTRVLAIALSAAFFVCAAFGIVSVSAVSAHFMEGKSIKMRMTARTSVIPQPPPVQSLTDKQFDSYKVYTLTGDGAYLLVASCLNMAATMHTAYAGINCLRTVCACRRAKSDTESDKGSDAA